ncbi:MAG: tetratricopeptide repeat protein, partial [Myxococcales bacterium]|nr:tetratricopeptide repeat protein [Myxococcales bacterium]
LDAGKLPPRHPTPEPLAEAPAARAPKAAASTPPVAAAGGDTAARPHSAAPPERSARAEPKAAPRHAAASSRASRDGDDAAAAPTAEPAGDAPFVDGRPRAGQTYTWYLHHGRDALRDGDVVRARAYYESALEVRPGASEANAGLGGVALASGDADLAVSRFQLAARSGLTDAYAGLGDAYRRLGRTKEALEAYGTFLKLRPTGPRSDTVRAVVQSLQGARPAATPAAPEASDGPAAREPEAPAPSAAGSP